MKWEVPAECLNYRKQEGGGLGSFYNHYTLSYCLGMWQSGENGSSRHLCQKWHPKQSTPSSSAMTVVQGMISYILDRRWSTTCLQHLGRWRRCHKWQGFLYSHEWAEECSLPPMAGESTMFSHTRVPSKELTVTSQMLSIMDLLWVPEWSIPPRDRGPG